MWFLALRREPWKAEAGEGLSWSARTRCLPLRWELNAVNWYQHRPSCSRSGKEKWKGLHLYDL